MTYNNPATDEEVEAALGVSTDNIQGFYHAPKIGPASHVIRDVHAGEELWRMRTADYEIGHAAMMREIERIKMRAILNAASRIRAETAKNSGEEVVEALRNFTDGRNISYVDALAEARRVLGDLS